MVRIKKLVVVVLVGLGGFLLVLAGFDLVQISQNLLLYIGFLYLALAVLSYIFL